eukprot:TRINITY_DN16312_c0_g1_i1.p1 TRINITY_DN16312_c0_g1~~TRINITY_DN16312_c0_g1_i1.p1  ORF type:complete len:116 (-),score=9.02 TRINITY_DN16312_c0_g1_i1:6-353(-)
MQRRKVVRLAKGYRGRAKNCYSIARRRVEKGLKYAYAARRIKKREFRKIWIARINAGTRQYGIRYNLFIQRIHMHEIAVNRKMLAELAITEPYSFRAITKEVMNPVPDMMMFKHP